MKLSHVILAAVIAAGVFAYIKFGRAAHKTTQSIATSLIAIPNQAATRAAESNVQQALGALGAYYTDHGTYVGASAAALQTYNTGVSPSLVVVGPTATSFCVEDTVDGATASATSTTGPAVAGPCP